MGYWQTPSDAILLLSDITTNNVSTTKHGFVPKAPNNATEFLDGTGNWNTGTYTSFTPSWTNLTVGTGGNAYNTGYYLQVGKQVFIHGRVTLGTTGSAMGAASFTLPISISTTTYPTGASYLYILGETIMHAAGANFWGNIIYNAGIAADAAQPTYFQQSNTQISGLGATSPATWGAGDYITYKLQYEAA